MLKFIRDSNRKPKGSLIYIFTLVISVCWSGYAFGERLLSEREFLARCYAQLTGARLSVRDPLWTQLSQSSAINLCAGLIDSVQLASDGNLVQSTNSVHRQILRQFNDIHRDWLPTHSSYSNTFPDTYFGVVDLYDADEPALYMTRSLFSREALPYRSVLSGNQALYAIRDASTPKANARGTSGTLRPSRAYVGDAAPADQQPAGILEQQAVAAQGADGSYFAIPVSLLQVGQLKGIGVSTDMSATSNLWTNNFQTTATPNDATLVRPHRFHAGFGGGALGSTPFLLTNFGHGFDFKANGAAALPRRIMFAAMNSFLCHTGPFVRSSDVGSYLAASTDTTAASFRRGTSCLRCHATLDQAAMTMRNLRLGSTVNNTSTGVSRVPAMVLTSTVTQPPEATAWSPNPDPLYYLRPPTGRFYFRSVSGALVDRPLTNMNDLGQAMADTDDFYACAASRYFKYFTGINVGIYDPGETANQALLTNMSEKELEYRNYVLQLGRDLRASQSLKQLVKTILQSRYYKLVQFGR